MTTLGVRRVGLVLGGVVLLLALVWLGASSSLRGYNVGVGFDAVDVGDTVYAAIGEAQDDLIIRRVWVDAVGPIEVEVVRCPGIPLGTARDCPGGPVPAVGVPVIGGDVDAGVVPEAIIALAITRRGDAEAAVCEIRLLFTSGPRAGMASASTEVHVPAVGESLADDWHESAERRCG